MSRSRKDFTDHEKAQIFKRDRATCCFSGANLWLLDAPLFHYWESDWVDHVNPASRGGKTEILNGVCASATFNAKKRNNSADTGYLFKEGCPTATYFELFGLPSPEVINRLMRLSAIELPDWYFNKAIDRIFQALHHRCWKLEHSRDDSYWFTAAYKRLVVFQESTGAFKTIEERNLIGTPSETQALLLSLRKCDSYQSFRKQALTFGPKYNKNAKIWWNYFRGGSHNDSPVKDETRRRKLFDKIFSMKDELTSDTFECIHADFSIRFGTAR